MFLGAYHLDGDPSVLIPAYERLLSTYPPDSLDLHVCISREDGLTVFDACPSRQVFSEFTQSPEFAMALANAGLPAPRIEALGEVHRARIREAVQC